VEKGDVRDIALQALRDMRRRPSMGLLLSAAYLPVVFLFYFLAPGSPPNLYFILLLAGYSICFVLPFYFWCMAVALFDDDARKKKGGSYAAAYRRMLRFSRSELWVGVFYGLLNVLAFMVAQMVVSLVLSMAAAGTASQGSLVVLSLVHFYLSYLAADLAMVLLVLAPQVVLLEGGGKVDEVMRVSYQAVKKRYRDALILFILPELVIRTLFLGASFLIYYVPGVGLVFSLLLLSMILFEGARTSFVAAAFNRFYYRVLEEEKRSRRAKAAKKKKGKSGR
jgi:hypothetical protein